MAKILFLTHVLPYPLDGGAKVRAYHMLRHLSGKHQVTLVSFVRPEDKPEAVAHLQNICSAVYPVPIHRSFWRNLRGGIKGLLTGLPMLAARGEIKGMTTTLLQLARETAFDVIHADQLSMAGYGRLAADAARNSPPRTLLDEHNAVYFLAERSADIEQNRLYRAIIAREARAYARYEAAMCRDYDEVLTVTPEDKNRLLALFSADEQAGMNDKFTVVPISVDPDQVSSIPHKNGDAPTVLHLGTMFWPPNINGVLWFAREVLPLIQQKIPETRFVVVGKRPPAEIQALTTDPRVKVMGYVPDPTPYLATSDVFIVPLHAGAGMRVKILDAWLWGLPIVSTPIGAEGIHTRPGENILIAQNAQEFAQATIDLLTNRELNQQFRVNGRTWVEANYGWQTIYPQMDYIYARLLSR